MKKSHAFLPKLFHDKSLSSLREYLVKEYKKFPKKTYWKDIHLIHPSVLKIIPSNLDEILVNLLNNNKYRIETVELHIQNPNSESIPAHQDNFYHCTEFDKSLKILVPLQEFNNHNGGLFYFDTDYDFPILPHKPSKTPNFSSYIEEKDISKLNYTTTCYSYKLGDASYHFINNIHYSIGNKSSFQTLFIVYRFITNDAKEDQIALDKYKKCLESHSRLI